MWVIGVSAPLLVLLALSWPFLSFEEAELSGRRG
jgi:hypothetical protein